MNLPTLDDEIRQMRDRLSHLESEIARLRERTPALSFPRFLRPALTWTAIESNYPNKSESDEFPFVFCDIDDSGEFTKRSASEDGTARFPDAFHLPRETEIYVLEHKGQFLIERAAFVTIRFISLTANMAGGSAACNFLDFEGGDTAVDPFNKWANAESGDTGLVQWRNGTWQIIDIYRCGAITEE